MSVSGVALPARAEVAAQCVGAVSKDIAGSVLALVLIGHVATLATVAVVTVALTVQTGTVFTFAACCVATVV